MKEMVVCNICEGEFGSLELYKEHWKAEHLINYAWFGSRPAIFHYTEEELVRERINEWKKTNHVPQEMGWCGRCDEPFRWNKETDQTYCKCPQSLVAVIDDAVEKSVGMDKAVILCYSK